MRAWQVQQPGEPADALHLVDAPVPQPGPDQVRIAVRAAAIGLPDVFMCRGTYPLTPKGRFVPGQEVAGVVDAAGTDVAIERGTRVMAITDFVHGHGGAAQYTIADARNVYVVPAAMSDVDAAGFLIAYQTAWVGLVGRAAVQPDDVVLVLGAAGGTGSAAVQLARALGATVIAVVSGERKAAHCRRLGAAHVIDRAQERVSDAVRRITDGHGTDVVYDPVGGPVAHDAMRAVARGGRFLLVGFASGAWPDIDAARLVVGDFAVVGVYAGATTREENEAMLDAMFELVATGALQPQSEARACEELPQALTDLAAGQVQGRLVAVLR